MEKWRRLIRSVKFFRRFIPYFLRNSRFLISSWRLVRGTAQCAEQFDCKQTIALPPHSLTIGITERCNLRCRQWGQWGEKGIYLTYPVSEPSNELSTEEIKQLIDELAPGRPFAPMKFVSFEDTTGIYETVLFPKVYHRFCHILNEMRPYLLKGKVEQDFTAITLTVNGIEFLDRHNQGNQLLLRSKTSLAHA